MKLQGAFFLIVVVLFLINCSHGKRGGGSRSRSRSSSSSSGFFSRKKSTNSNAGTYPKQDYGSGSQSAAEVPKKTVASNQHAKPSAPAHETPHQAANPQRPVGWDVPNSNSNPHQKVNQPPSYSSATGGSYGQHYGQHGNPYQQQHSGVYNQHQGSYSHGQSPYHQQPGVYNQPPNPYQSNPYHSNPYNSNPYNSNPYNSNPYNSNPYNSNPYNSNPYNSNPYHSNPYNSNPYHGSPYPSQGYYPGGYNQPNRGGFFGGGGGMFGGGMGGMGSGMFGGGMGYSPFGYGYGMKKSGGGFFGRHAFRNILGGLLIWHVVSGLTRTPYRVYNYYNRPEIEPEIKMPSNVLTLCDANVSNMCVPNTIPICTTNNTVMCVSQMEQATPCPTENAALCVNSTIECVGGKEDPLCQNNTKNENFTTLNLPCFANLTVDVNLQNFEPNKTAAPPEGAGSYTYCVTTYAVAGPEESCLNGTEDKSNCTNFNSTAPFDGANINPELINGTSTGTNNNDGTPPPPSDGYGFNGVPFGYGYGYGYGIPVSDNYQISTGNKNETDVSTQASIASSGTE